jgi:asparagine synthase (glutamine-hydrolysing)
MCGICITWGNDTESTKKAIEALKARGPDATQTLVLDHGITVGFTRLHIQGATEGAEQPFRMRDGSVIVCNGEIFNYKQLIHTLDLEVPEGSSDCAVVPALLERGMPLTEVARQLDGDFAIVYIDLTGNRIQACRDPYGVRPLFFGGDCLASELKGLPVCQGALIEALEPGTVFTVDLTSGLTSSVVWHQTPWLKHPAYLLSSDGIEKVATNLRYTLEEAVLKRLATVREIGACLSGGLDSSLIAALAAFSLRHKDTRLHTYSIGMEGSPDLKHARLVASYIGSIHHERIVTAEECLAVIPEVVRAIESFDITTVRASVGNYLVGRLIATETPHVKVVLNGDGADELLGGYLYMRAAPDDVAFETETSRLLQEIHRYDVLRSERSMAAHGLESRSPFLDRQFVSVARSLPTALLRPTTEYIEKHILRYAFLNTGILPDKVLWRRKEAFSDGISRAEKSWFEMAKEAGEAAAASVEGGWAVKAAAYTVNPPKTAEAFWYRTLFHQWYPQEAAAVIPAMWMPRFVKGATDPSARTLALYTNI